MMNKSDLSLYDLGKQFFEGTSIRLTAYDPATNPKEEVAFTYDLDYSFWMRDNPARPMAEQELQKYYEKLIKEGEESNQGFVFTVRSKIDDQMLGFARLCNIEWNHAVGEIRLAIGAADNREGAELEALQMMLAYAFEELNLFRVSRVVSESNPISIRTTANSGMVLEVRQREAYFRCGKYWDVLRFGLVEKEYDELVKELQG